MFLPIAIALIILGGLGLTRARAFLHWKRGYKRLSSWQRTWLVKGEHVRTFRIYSAVVLAAGVLLLAGLTQLGLPQQVAELGRGLEATRGLGQHPPP